MRAFPRTARLLAAAVLVILGVETGSLAQEPPPLPPATDPGGLPPLPPPPGEPPGSPPPAKTGMDVDWHASAPPEPSTTPTPDDDEPVRPAHRKQPEPRWYGWQIIVTDGTAVASGTAAVLSASPSDSAGGALVFLSGLMYLGGGPTVHFAQGNITEGAASLTFRLTFPLVGALVGAVAGRDGNGCDGPERCTSPAFTHALIGSAFGMFAASVVDIAVLAYAGPPGESHARVEPPRLQLAPVAALPRDSAGHVAPTFGLVGSF